MDNPKRILIAPLNWGLGHATRCIPIIEALKAMGAEVFLASDGAALHLLEKEYPELPAFQLPSYNIRYQGRNMIWNMLGQLPRIASAIFQERKALHRLVLQEKIDIVISDNRYGCFSAATYNVFLTHQLHIQAPSKILQTLARQVNYWLLRRFEEYWIPDLEHLPNLSGDLSHPADLANIHYLGLLSRMKYYQRAKQYDIAVVLSGPEPQRTYLEERILAQVKKTPDLKILLVQGLPRQQKREITGNLEIISYLTSRDLNNAMLAADLILCRSGYSSLMDLAKLCKKALLIPTPGQTEQEYLAAHLMQQGLFYSVPQKNLDLSEAIEQAKKYPGFKEDFFPEGQLKNRLKALLGNA